MRNGNAWLLPIAAALCLLFISSGMGASEDSEGAVLRISVEKNCVTEIFFYSSVAYPDPYNDVRLDAVFEGPDKISLRVPAFWAGDNVWGVRFAGEKIGEYVFTSVCSNPEDQGLHGLRGIVTVLPYGGTNPLLQHGRLQVAKDGQHFEQQDGTPFFWLGDTWWMGLTERLDWPHGFKELTADRVNKGFNLIQIVAGPLPDMDAWDQRGRNEAGFPFTEGFARVNTRFYDHADLKIGHLVRSGLMPCIVGMWGYHLPRIGVEQVKRYWRYIVARYGAYPVVWCVAGEVTMPYYLSSSREEDKKLQRKGWCEVAAYLRDIDPYGNLMTIHPGTNARDMRECSGLFDFEMLQTGHSGLATIPYTIQKVSAAVARRPRMPVINAEINYEGIRGQSWQDIQRLSFYCCVFNGTAGHTYGANGIWQVNEKDRPYGPSPHGRSWGSMSWQEAAQLPGGTQAALGGRFMARFPWWKLEKHREWIDCQQAEDDPRAVRAIGIPRLLRLVYVPMLWALPVLKEIEPDVTYDAYYFDPCSGAEYGLGQVVPDAEGRWQPPPSPEGHDWLIVLEAVDCNLR